MEYRYEEIRSSRIFKIFFYGFIKVYKINYIFQVQMMYIPLYEIYKEGKNLE